MVVDFKKVARVAGFDRRPWFGIFHGGACQAPLSRVFRWPTKGLLPMILIVACAILSVRAAESRPRAAQWGSSPAVETAGTQSGDPEAIRRSGKAASKKRDKSFFQVLVEGGFVMIPLAVCSALALALITDGFIRIRNLRVAPPALVEQIRNAFRAGDYEQAYQVCKTNPCVVADVLRGGISMLGEGKQSAEGAMSEALARENVGMQTRISYLSVIGVVTPMIGLLGTVVGMIKAFSTLGSSGIGDPSSLSAAIGEVLVATASGLFVAIPAFGAFYFFRNRVAAVTMHVEDVINGLFRRIPYSELAGAHIGDEPIYAAAPRRQGESETEKRVSRRISVMLPCPACNTNIAAGSPVCPTCNTSLQWN